MQALMGTYPLAIAAAYLAGVVTLPVGLAIAAYFDREPGKGLDEQIDSEIKDSLERARRRAR